MLPCSVVSGRRGPPGRPWGDAASAGRRAASLSAVGDRPMGRRGRARRCRCRPGRNRCAAVPLPAYVRLCGRCPCRTRCRIGRGRDDQKYAGPNPALVPKVQKAVLRKTDRRRSACARFGQPFGDCSVPEHERPLVRKDHQVLRGRPGGTELRSWSYHNKISAGRRPPPSTNTSRNRCIWSRTCSATRSGGPCPARAAPRS